MFPLLVAFQTPEPPLWDRLVPVVPVPLLLVLLGALLVLLGVLLVLTVVRRREYRRSLEKSREWYRSFFRDDLTGDFLLDPSGRIVECNPAFARIFRYPSPAAAIGREVWELLPDRSTGISALRALRASGRLERLEMNLRARDGRSLHVVANLVASFDEKGEVLQIRGYLLDDTVRKELERRLVEARRIEAVGRLAGGIAHEFNNLLVSITGYAALLLDDLEPGDPRRADLEAILHAGDRGKELTGRLLAFGRRRMIRPEVIEVNEVVRGMEPILRRTCQDPCTIRTRYTLELPAVHVDPDHLEQVLVHLVLNARDAMDGVGTIRMVTATEEVTEDEGRRDGLRWARTFDGVRPRPSEWRFPRRRECAGEGHAGAGVPAGLRRRRDLGGRRGHGVGVADVGLGARGGRRGDSAATRGADAPGSGIRGAHRPPRLVLAGADLPDGPGAALMERLRDESGSGPRVLYLMSPHRPQGSGPAGADDPPEIPRTFTPESLMGAVRTLLAHD